MLTQHLTLDSTMQSVTVLGVSGVEQWPLMPQSGMLARSTALLKVQGRSHHN